MMRPDYLQSLERRVKELEPDHFDLKRKLWKLRYQGTKSIAIILICIGGASLLASYLYSSLILTFIGLGLTLWGAVIFYVLPSRHVPEKIMYAVALQMTKTLDSLLVSIGYKGGAIFYQRKYQDGLSQGYMFIPFDNVYKIPKEHEFTQEKVFYDNPKGISIVAPSQGLVELFEQELNVTFENVDLVYVKENLKRLLTEDLNLIDDLTVENSNGIIHARIVGRSCAYNCNSINEHTQLGTHLGCPLCAALAVVISKVAGKPVTIKETNVKNDSIETSYIILDL